jgi:hypothetical protein
MRPVRGGQIAVLMIARIVTAHRFSETGSVDNRCFHWGCLRAHFVPDQVASGIRITAVRLRL